MRNRARQSLLRTAPASTHHQTLRVSLTYFFRSHIAIACHGQTEPLNPLFLTRTTPTDNSDFQSDGLCAGFCASKWALAIVKGKACWCSDFVPEKGSQVDTGKCNAPCPGYPSDLCGADNLFGYMALKKSPAGTTGGNPDADKTPVRDRFLR